MIATIVKEIGVQCRLNRSRLRGFRKLFSRQIVTEAKVNGQDLALVQWHVDQKVIKIGNFVEKYEDFFLNECARINLLKFALALMFLLSS